MIHLFRRASEGEAAAARRRRSEREATTTAAALEGASLEGFAAARAHVAALSAKIRGDDVGGGEGEDEAGARASSSSSSSSRRIENENETQLYGTLHRSGTTWTTYSRVPEHLERALGEPERETSRCPHLVGAGMTRKPYALISKRESGDSGEGGRVRRGLHCRECWDRLETKRLAAAIVCADCGDCFPLSKTRTYPTVAGGRVRPITTLVPVRHRQRGERRSLRTFSPGVQYVSPRPPLAHNPDTPRRLSTPLLTPFNFTPQNGGPARLDGHRWVDVCFLCAPRRQTAEDGGMWIRPPPAAAPGAKKRIDEDGGNNYYEGLSRAQRMAIVNAAIDARTTAAGTKTNAKANVKANAPSTRIQPWQIGYAEQETAGARDADGTAALAIAREHNPGADRGVDGVVETRSEAAAAIEAMGREVRRAFGFNLPATPRPARFRLRVRQTLARPRIPSAERPDPRPIHRRRRTSSTRARRRRARATGTGCFRWRRSSGTSAAALDAPRSRATR